MKPSQRNKFHGILYSKFSTRHVIMATTTSYSSINVHECMHYNTTRLPSIKNQLFVCSQSNRCAHNRMFRTTCFANLFILQTYINHFLLFFNMHRSVGESETVIILKKKSQLEESSDENVIIDLFLAWILAKVLCVSYRNSSLHKRFVLSQLVILS